MGLLVSDPMKYPYGQNVIGPPIEKPRGNDNEEYQKRGYRKGGMVRFPWISLPIALEHFLGRQRKGMGYRKGWIPKRCGYQKVGRWLVGGPRDADSKGIE